MRQAFVMRLKPGAFPAYRDYHRAVWPELEKEFVAAGIERLSIFEAAGTVIAASEVTDEGAWRRVRDSVVHQRWAAHMEPLLDVDDRGNIETNDMTELYHYQGG